jgi:hypothetical protein
MISEAGDVYLLNTEDPQAQRKDVSKDGGPRRLAPHLVWGVRRQFTAVRVRMPRDFPAELTICAGCRLRFRRFDDSMHTVGSCFHSNTGAAGRYRVGIGFSRQSTQELPFIQIPSRPKFTEDY